MYRIRTYPGSELTHVSISNSLNSMYILVMNN